jgi:hypothetical protein
MCHSVWVKLRGQNPKIRPTSSNVFEVVPERGDGVELDSGAVYVIDPRIFDD